jgi:hypothetical protein
MALPGDIKEPYSTPSDHQEAEGNTNNTEDDIQIGLTLLVSKVSPQEMGTKRYQANTENDEYPQRHNHDYSLLTRASRPTNVSESPQWQNHKMRFQGSQETLKAHLVKSIYLSKNTFGDTSQRKFTYNTIYLIKNQYMRMSECGYRDSNPSALERVWAFPGLLFSLKRPSTTAQ